MRASTELVRVSRSDALAVLDQAVAPLSAALRLGTYVQECLIYDLQEKVDHYAGALPLAREVRQTWLTRFAETDAACCALALDGMYRQTLGRKTAGRMLVALLNAFGAKDEQIAALDTMIGLVVNGDPIALATGLWAPVNASPTSLALACQRLIACNTFVPKPAELAEACREARKAMRRAQDGTEQLRTYILRAEGVLLQFSRDEWRAPYLTPEFRPLVPRVLTLLSFLYGDQSNESLCDKDQKAFQQAIAEEKAALRAPAAEEPKRLAACHAKSAKRTRKARRNDA
jgi:hypothetical protein